MKQERIEQIKIKVLEYLNQLEEDIRDQIQDFREVILDMLDKELKKEKK